MQPAQAVFVLVMTAFLLAFLINTVIIWIATGLLGRASLGRAALAALLGSALTALIPPRGLLSALLGLGLWLVVLRELFSLSWGRTVLAALLIVVVGWAVTWLLLLAGFAVFSLLPQA